MYIDSELTEDAAGLVSEHLSECPRCATEREKLLSLRAELSAAQPLSAPDSIWSRLSDRVAAARPAASIWDESEPLVRRLIPVAATALVLLALLSFSLRRHETQPVSIETEMITATFSPFEREVLFGQDISTEVIFESSVYVSGELNRETL